MGKRLSLLSRPLAVLAIVSASIFTLSIRPPAARAGVTTITTSPNWKTTNALPPSGWNTNVNFDDSAWIAPATGSTNQVIWYGSIQDINSPSQAWFRFTFDLTAPLTSATAALGFDDDGEAYVNGTQIVADSSGGGSAFNLTLDPSLFVVGENLIAVHGINKIAPYNSIDETYTLTSAPAPEPSGILLLAAGSISLFVRKRRVCC